LSYFAGQAVEKPVFEVATIKRSANLNDGGTSSWRPGGVFRAVNVPVRTLVMIAYETPQRALLPTQVLDAPDWTVSDRYDVVAKVDPSVAALPPPELFRKLPALMHSLLQERFKLKAHQETRERPVFVVRIADSSGKLGPHLHASSTNCEAERSKCFIRFFPGHITAGAWAGDAMIRAVTASLERVVIDKTGLTGKYDFDLEWSPDQTATDKPSIFTALREQLGLTIDSERAPVEVLVIDHIEKPTED